MWVKLAKRRAFWVSNWKYIRVWASERILLPKDKEYGQERFIFYQPQESMAKMKWGSEVTLNLLIKQECINVSLSFWAFCVPWWDIITINDFSEPRRNRLADELRSRGYLHRLGWIMKCSNWESCPRRISNCSMLSTLVLSIGYNLQTRLSSMRN